MSHNITGKCKAVAIVDLEDQMVKEIAEEKFKWKFLGPGKWKAFSGQSDVQADMLVAVPQDQGSRYAQQLSEEEKKRLGLKGSYSVIAVTKGKAERVVPGQPPKPSGIEVTMDDHGSTGGEANVDVFMKNVTQAVNASRVIKKANAKMNVLGQAIAEGKGPPGAKVISPATIKAAVLGAMGFGGGNGKGKLKA
jgi:hypothetical protein